MCVPFFQLLTVTPPQFTEQCCACCARILDHFEKPSTCLCQLLSLSMVRFKLLEALRTVP